MEAMIGVIQHNLFGELICFAICVYVCVCVCFPSDLYYEGEGSLQFLWHYDALHSEDKSRLVGHP